MKTEVKNIPDKGRGVFACQDISEGEIIEKAHVIIIDKEQSSHIEKTILDDYVFLWKEDCAAVLGNGMMYNHSYEPNALYIRDLENKIMIYKALKNIAVGEEIFINYNGDPNSKDPVWFDVK